MRLLIVAAKIALLGSLALVSSARAAPTKQPVRPTDQDASRFAPFPADKSIRQSAVIAGHKIDYVATVGSIQLHDPTGKVMGDIVYVAYTVPGRSASGRPVTFSFNGGPGAAQLALNFGAIGPKHIPTGVQGSAPSDSAVAEDNPNSWLDFTDLVFIDPIGTGYSRSRLDPEATKKTFLTPDADIHYLAETVFQWLRDNGRMTSPKYLIGESYGGYRVPRLAEYLQTEIGAGISGITMVSPALATPVQLLDDTISPMRAMIDLPSEAATNLEAKGQPLTPEVMAPIETYARTQFVADLLAGPADEAATRRLEDKVTELTGLDPALVRRQDGRVDLGTFLREFHRRQGRIGSAYDANVTTADPFPASSEANYDDPILATEAPLEEAMVDLIDRQIGWKIKARYIANNYDLNRDFEHETQDRAVVDLRKALANDPNMRVLISHGWTDFSCPFFGSRLILNQMPSYGVKDRVSLKVYPGGHMFYDRPTSAAAWRRDALQMYR